MDDAQINVNINEIVEQSLKDITSLDNVQTKEDNIKASSLLKEEPPKASQEFIQPVADKDHDDKAIFEKVAQEAEPLKEYEEIVF